MGIKHRAEGLKKQWEEGTLHEPYVVHWLPSVVAELEIGI